MNGQDPKDLRRQPVDHAPLNALPPLESHRQVLAYLFANGHFCQTDEDNFATDNPAWSDVLDLQPDDPEFLTAVESWRFLRPHLQPTGPFDTACGREAQREAGYRCALPDILHRTARVSRWPDECKNDITTCHALGSLPYPSSDNDAINDAWQHGLARWNEAADLTLKTGPVCPTARIHARTQPLGSYILAWSELATGDCDARLQQGYNSRITWTWHLLWTTICHEIGHAIGIAHGGNGIMQPAHDPSVSELGPWDLDQLVQRYGQPPPPTPPPGPPTEIFHHAVIILYDAKNNPIGSFDVQPQETK